MPPSPCYNACKGRHCMEKRKFTPFIAFFLAFICVTPVSADVREEPVALFLVLDKSLSMVEEIGPVKEYVNTFIIDNFLIPGDFFTLIQFYGEAHTLIQTYIEDQAKKESLQRQISSIPADGSFTDIGNALDTLEMVVEEYPDDGRRTYLILITDGIQEAPPWSEYYSPDGSFNHAFLEHTKTIQKKGWKIQILGIGTETAAEEVARELSGGYTEIPSAEDVSDLEDSTEDIFGVVELTSLSLSPLRSDGTAVLTLNLLASGYRNAAELTIQQIIASVPGLMEREILPEPVILQVFPEEEIAVDMPVAFPGGREVVPENAETEFRFIFTGSESFVPSFAVVRVEYAGFLAEHLPAFLLACAGLVICIVGVVIILRRRSSGGVQFSCTIEGRPKVTKGFTLRRGGRCYIGHGASGFTLSPRKTGVVCAEVTAPSAGTLKLTVKNDTLFHPVDILPANVLNSRIKFRKSDGTHTYISFSRDDTTS